MERNGIVYQNNKELLILNDDATIGGKLGTTGTITAGSDVILTPHTPASAAAAGTVGTIAVDSGFVYVCTATNTWKRVAVATW